MPVFVPGVTVNLSERACWSVGHRLFSKQVCVARWMILMLSDTQMCEGHEDIVAGFIAQKGVASLGANPGVCPHMHYLIEGCVCASIQECNCETESTMLGRLHSYHFSTIVVIIFMKRFTLRPVCVHTRGIHGKQRGFIG